MRMLFMTLLLGLGAVVSVAQAQLPITVESAPTPFNQSLNTINSPQFANLTLTTAGALRSDTTTAHTALLNAYDVDGTAYKTFATLTNGNTPDFTIAPPAGGTVNIQGVYKANDGTAGLTQSCAAAVVALTIKNGLITAVTCP